MESHIRALPQHVVCTNALRTLIVPCQVDGVRRATPLLLVLACIELSDIVFAVDSIPAVFAVTKVSYKVARCPYIAFDASSLEDTQATSPMTFSPKVTARVSTRADNDYWTTSRARLTAVRRVI